jgi:hypothetical protein
MATTDLAITDTPLRRIRDIAIIMRQHGLRIMRIGRAGKEVKAAASYARSFATLAAIRLASSLLSNLAADLRPGSSSK